MILTTGVSPPLHKFRIDPNNYSLLYQDVSFGNAIKLSTESSCRRVGGTRRARVVYCMALSDYGGWVLMLSTCSGSEVRCHAPVSPLRSAT